MRFLMQRPLPDELLSSAWIRTCRATGLAIGRLTESILGRKTAPGFFQAGDLAMLAPFMGLSPRELLQNHSTLPYALAFYTPIPHATALAAAGSSGTDAFGLGAVTQSVSDRVRYRRWCSTCAALDRKNHGLSYWRRSHNLPGVLVCTVHQRPLRESTLPTAGRTSWDYGLPGDGNHDRRNLATPHAPLALLTLAQLSTRLLQLDFTQCRPREPDWYRQQLVARGLLTSGRDVHATKLAQWAAKVLGPTVHRVGLRTNEENLAWLALMVRPCVGIPFPPLKHLLFETALRLHMPTDAERVDYVPTGMRPHYAAEHDCDAAKSLGELVDASLAAGTRLGVKEALCSIGFWEPYRHDRQRFPKVDAAVRRLRRSGIASRRLKRRTAHD